MEFLEVMLVCLMILLLLVLAGLVICLCWDTGKIREGSSENHTHSTQSSSEEDGIESGDKENSEAENEANVFCLSAGGATVVRDETLSTPEPAWPGGPWISYPRKSSLPHFHGRAQLNKGAKFKHIDPACKSEKRCREKIS